MSETDPGLEVVNEICTLPILISNSYLPYLSGAGHFESLSLLLLFIKKFTSIFLILL